MRYTEAIRCALLGLLGLTSLGAQSPASVAHIQVDPNQRFQVIEGFGANFTGPYFREDQKSMFNLLIEDMGVTMFRVVPYLVYSNWEEHNDNDDPNVMNWEYYNNRYSTPIFETTWSAIRYLNSRGIRPVVALMGPVPAWMVDDHATPPKHRVCQPKSTQAPIKPSMYPEFAEEVVSMIMYARQKERLEFEYFSPFNETDCYPTEGPRIDPEDAPKVLAAVARRLDKEGLSGIKLVAADQAVMATDYPSPILADAELMKKVAALAFHSYGGGSLQPHVELVQKSSYPQTSVWLTEYGGQRDQDRTAGNEWKDFALGTSRRGLNALNQGASALFYFNAFDDYEECMGRLTYFGLFTSADHVYTPRKRYYATRQLYHFVTPGSQRIGAAADSRAITVSAFHDGSSDQWIVTGVKEGGANRVRMTLAPARRMPKFWDLYLTTRQLNCQKTGRVSPDGEVVELNLPDEAVFTLVGKLND